MDSCCEEKADHKDDSSHLGWHIAVWYPGIRVVDVRVVGCIFREACNNGWKKSREVLEGEVGHVGWYAVVALIMWKEVRTSQRTGGP